MPGFNNIKMKITKKMKKQQSSKLSKIKKRRQVALAPIDELENALKILNANEDVKKNKRNLCKPIERKSSDITHLSSIHYCSLIKEAILKHDWRHVMKLLLAYIDEPKSDKHTSGIILKYTLIFLLNDPVAQSLDILNEFLQLVISCQTQTEREEFLKLIKTIPCIKNESLNK